MKYVKCDVYSRCSKKNQRNVLLSLPKQVAKLSLPIKHTAGSTIMMSYGKEKNRNTFNESRDLYPMEC